MVSKPGTANPTLLPDSKDEATSNQSALREVPNDPVQATKKPSKARSGGGLRGLGGTILQGGGGSEKRVPFQPPKKSVQGYQGTLKADRLLRLALQGVVLHACRARGLRGQVAGPRKR